MSAVRFTVGLLGCEAFELGALGGFPGAESGDAGAELPKVINCSWHASMSR
jgi:hypothetical protein